MRALVIGLIISTVLFFSGFAVFLVLFLAKQHAAFEPIWEALPSQPGALLDCSDLVDRTWWASKGGDTTLCVFSGDSTLGIRGVTELEVREMCLAKRDCGGYTKTQTVNYGSVTATLPVPSGTTCTDDSTGASVSSISGAVPNARLQAYNKSQPEYKLYSKGTLKDLVPTTRLQQGMTGETTHVTWRRKM